MATAARKARKAAGIEFTKAPKVVTPLTKRAWFNELLPGAPGTRFVGSYVPRSEKKKLRALKARSL